MQRFAINPRTNRGRQPRPLNLVTCGRGRTPSLIQRAAITPIARIPQIRQTILQPNREYRPFNVPPMLPVNTEHILISAVLNTSISTNVMKVNSPEVAAVLSGLRSSSKDRCTQIKHPEVADLLQKLLKLRPAKTPETGAGVVINMISDSDESCIEEVSREIPVYNNPVESDKVNMDTSKPKSDNIADDVTGSDPKGYLPTGTHTVNSPQSPDLNNSMENDSIHGDTLESNIENDVTNTQTTTPVRLNNTITNSDAAKTALKEPGKITSGDDCDTSDTTADLMDSLDLSDPLLDETLANHNKTNQLYDNNMHRSKGEQEPSVSTTSINIEPNVVKREQQATDLITDNTQENECRETPLSILN